jgi:hypothetical protein
MNTEMTNWFNKPESRKLQAIYYHSESLTRAGTGLSPSGVLMAAWLTSGY